MSVESSSISEDSQTVLLNHPATSSQSTAQSPLLIEDSQTQDDRPSPPNRVDTNDLKKCWICFADEREDAPMNSEWRSPCPCALVAHEACLLDWIADIEAPGNRRSTARSGRIECPQCKSEIVVARPKSYLVDLVRRIENSSAKIVWPGVLSIGASAIWRLCYEYGAITVWFVFGPEDAQKVLYPLLQLPSPGETELESLGSYMRNTWRLHAGLPLIPPILIFSRTSLGDSILPILPMLFFATSPAKEPLAEMEMWPPSAALSFAALPYIRAAYNFYYEKVWGERERRWLKEIRPRSTSNNEGDAHGDNPADVDEDGFDLEINMAVEDIVEEEAHAANAAQPDPALPVDQFDAAQVPANADAQAQQDPQAPAPQPAANGPIEHRHERQIHLSPTRIAESVLGAIAFPFVSAALGDILRLVLPTSWTTRSASVRVGPFLANRWARSIVGGCAYVVLRDAVMLYVRWKMVQQHRRRRVCEFDRVNKRIVRPRGSEQGRA
jgi:hypothetical protein